jgi:hypothetical protein
MTARKSGIEDSQIGKCSDVLPKVTSDKGQIAKKATAATGFYQKKL